MLRQVVKASIRSLSSAHPAIMNQPKNDVINNQFSPNPFNEDRFEPLLKGRNDAFLSQLQELQKECSEMSRFCHEYDFNDVPHNGFRSFLEFMKIYLDEIERLVQEENSTTMTKKGRRMLTEYQACMRLLKRQVKILKMIRSKDCSKEENSNEISEIEKNDLSALSYEILDELLKFEPNDLIPFHMNCIRNFWLKPHSRKMMNMFQDRLVTKLVPLHQVLPMLLDAEFKRKTAINFYLNAYVDEQRKVWCMIEDGLARTINAIKNFGSSVRVNWIGVPRQSSVLITPSGQVSFDAESETNNVRSYSIPSMVVSSGTNPSNEDRLIFHCHGGGFVSMTPRGHEAYLRVWSQALGVPVVCPNYGKAPELPYPMGLQDLLDTFLYITSGKDEVKHLLGFHPKNIVISGDSAGGNLALSLLQVLLDIKCRNPSQIIPCGLFLCYPCGDASVRLSASRTLISYDPILSLAACFGIASAYSGIEVPPGSVPWWRRSKEEIQHVVQQVSKKTSDPLFNPLSSSKWNSLTSISLFIQACQFDPLLDDSIAIAKTWKGPVELKVVEGVAHGYLIGVGTPGVQAPLEDSIRMIRQAFEEKQN